MKLALIATVSVLIVVAVMMFCSYSTLKMTPTYSYLSEKGIVIKTVTIDGGDLGFAIHDAMGSGVYSAVSFIGGPVSYVRNQYNGACELESSLPEIVAFINDVKRLCPKGYKFKSASSCDLLSGDITYFPEHSSDLVVKR